MKIWDRLSGGGKTALLFVLGALGVLCVLLGTLGRGGGTTDETSAEKSFSALAYIEETENKIRTITEQITGSDNVKVMVRISAGAEYVYASSEENVGGSSQKKYLTVEGSDGEKLVLIQEIFPPIEGVSIVCAGGDDPQVQAKLIAVLSVSLGITSNRICIVGTKS